MICVSDYIMLQTMNFDINLIKIGRERRKLLVFEDFNMTDMGAAAILNIFNWMA